jgi:hypothetical protein
MVVAILNLIFVGHVHIIPDEVLGDYYTRTKARLCNLENVHKWFFGRKSGTKFDIKGKSI